MITSQGFGKICEFSNFTPQLQTKDDVDNSKLIYLPGTNCPLKTHTSLSAFTSYRVGGEAECYVSPYDLEALQVSIEYAKENNLAITVLGAGSNLLVSDRGIPGLVIATRHLRSKNFDPTTGQLTVSAGEPIPTLAWDAAALGWEGLEWAVGIPGTVGGAVVMNAGAHNSCIADMLVSAQVLSPDGTLATLTPEELGYTYRSSLLQGRKRIVTQATFQLQPGSDPVQVTARTKEHKKHRLSTQPYSYPSCGSVFRNPKPYSAGWLIEQTGLKGYQLGGAQVAQLHANFIVNRGGAKASDIFSLIRHVQNEVQERWSIWLEPEVKMLGEFQLNIGKRQ
ncbi:MULTISPECIES: UDP-N-acetylmuramate dehydrogenase [Nostocales]|jgi:UDP-N-acetylmuramate dehydrogenase|uniref:UDP-N-acetylmuramate dehydrogenase n=1 Tax=Dolichospermum flos-aquae UHCC 0037 TaxID=2590026 RepID=A0ACC7S1H1_DOLFA|nr:MULTISPECIES: UDP-N-acetylmuramate dehydrogenase [Nostocales]ALB42334.1 UDP-N-acetylenolpyruvoylglucosamine reductase [Anabaena sp. WA102]MBO1063411.1 UDP-N-acetylmuramate dehydrogenase [Anabaena sp. 54]MCX5983261.1 UDP-N-acetylmuramate dehydrogenase [Nostocales cyanobacterium LacPavin_0920_SED1_MAG_38_18]MTJ42353.1 UDP-N-acetylmuramate dehydrogenase [Dolichospermum flos-aquae UHCC 0037]